MIERATFRLAPVIPFHRLPEGFLRLLSDPPDPPAQPRPSATLVLLRKGEDGLEVLLMKRSPRAGFIPGAWVFPGGTVDPEDADPRLHTLLSGPSSNGAKERLQPGSHEPPALAYWIAAIRETFEETGIFLVKPSQPPGPSRERVASARTALLAGEVGFRRLLQELDVTLDAGALEYNGHWLTPLCEPRRYETRFFVTEVGADVPVTPHEKEMVDAIWMRPEDALARNVEGAFPLVFPTLFTLEELTAFQTPGDALDFLKDRPVPLRLPRPVRAEGGVRFFITD